MYVLVVERAEFGAETHRTGTYRRRHWLLVPALCPWTSGSDGFWRSAVSTEVLLEAGIRRRFLALSSEVMPWIWQWWLSQALRCLPHSVSDAPPRFLPNHCVLLEPTISSVPLIWRFQRWWIHWISSSGDAFWARADEVLETFHTTSCYVVGRSVAEVAQDSRFPNGFIGQPHPHEDLTIPNGGTVLEPGSTVLIVKPGITSNYRFYEGCR